MSFQKGNIILQPSYYTWLAGPVAHSGGGVSSFTLGDIQGRGGVGGVPPARQYTQFTFQ